MIETATQCTIEHNNSSEVTSQERDLTTASVTSNEESLFQQQTTVVILPAELITPANTTSEGSSSYNVIEGTPFNDTLSGSEGNDLISGLAGNDVLFGFSGDDILDGGSGVDQMNGGAGNDVYYVDNVSDQVVELAGLGVDIVYTSVSYILPVNVENGTALGSANINLTGNGIDNVLTGNSGSNFIDGGAGADTMVGGLGSDNYVVNNVNDEVIENPFEGQDSIFTSVSFTLPDNVENLVAQGGVFDITLTGNSGDNFIVGGQGNNVLIGAGGADTFVFDLNLGGGFGNDTVNDFTVAQGDKLLFRGVLDNDGVPGLSVNDLISMETAAVSHPNAGADTLFTFATGSVTLAGINVSDFNDPAIAAQIIVQA